jgi:predicted transposase YbfD/YdcC
MRSSNFLRDSNSVFHRSFSSLPDPRRTSKGHFRYPLDEILFLVISAVVSGADGWVSIHDFGVSKLVWLRQYLPYKNGVPSHDVLGKVFALINPFEFNKCFTQWINSLSTLTVGEVVAIDGKTLCGSAKEDRSAFHLVSAYATKNRLCLAQQCVDEKSNEITAIPVLLDMLAIQSCVVTLDAMGCQQEIAQKILNKKADYILMVKDNQKSLKQQIEKVFTLEKPFDSHQQTDMGHGRVEKRECSVINKLAFLDDSSYWPGLQSIVRIKSERAEKKTRKITQETRYYISSLKENASQLNSKIRQHWAVENNLHWSLDVIFNEDALLMKSGNSAVNFSIINKMALALVDREKSTKMSKPSKRFTAALDDDYRSLVLKC